MPSVAALRGESLHVGKTVELLLGDLVFLGFGYSQNDLHGLLDAMDFSHELDTRDSEDFTFQALTDCCVGSHLLISDEPLLSEYLALSKQEQLPHIN